MTSLSSNLRKLWRRLLGIDIAALVIFVLGLAATIVGMGGVIPNFIKFLAVLAIFYFLFRFIGWWRSRLLWSLRNRLDCRLSIYCGGADSADLTLGVLSGRILYSQLGAYLLYEDIHARINTIGDMAEHIAAAH